MPKKDSLWEHASDVSEKNDERVVKMVQCSFCKETFMGGITRMKYHWAKLPQNDVRQCKEVPDPIKKKAKIAIDELNKKKRKNPVTSNIEVEVKEKRKGTADTVVAKWLLSNKMPLNLSSIQGFREVCRVISDHGPGYQPPNEDTLARAFVKELKGEVDEYVDAIKESWKSSGVTLVIGWKSVDDDDRVTFDCLLAHSNKVTVFLKLLSYSGYDYDSGSSFFENALIEGVREVGPLSNFVQLIWDRESEKVDAVKLDGIFITRGAWHFIDDILADIFSLEFVHPIIEHAKRVRYVINASQALQDLLKMSYISFPSEVEYLLRRLFGGEEIRSIVVSANLESCEPHDRESLVELRKLTGASEFWNLGIALFHAIKPLLEARNMACDDDGVTTIGDIVKLMGQTKKYMKELYFICDEEKFNTFWEAVEKKILTQPLVAAATALNPYSSYFGCMEQSEALEKELREVITKIETDDRDKALILEEYELYRKKDLDIPQPQAFEFDHPRYQPSLWWKRFGVKVPKLQELAIKILNLPCSNRCCARALTSLSIPEFILTRALESESQHDLLYYMVNDHMRKMHCK